MKERMLCKYFYMLSNLEAKYIGNLYMSGNMLKLKIKSKVSFKVFRQKLSKVAVKLYNILNGKTGKDAC